MFNQTQIFHMNTIFDVSETDLNPMEIPPSLVSFLWFETIAAFIGYGLGFISNLIALIIFCSLEEFRKISTGVLFILITISNFFHLWTLATEFLAIYGYKVYSNVFFQCRLNFFVENVSRAMSTYLSITIAIDRLIRSEKPLRSRELCTSKNVFKLTIIYFIIFSLFWSFYLLPMSNQDSVTGNCLYNQSSSYHLFLVSIHIPIRAIFLCFIPAIIMATANIRMLVNIRQSRKRVSDAIQIIQTHGNRLSGISQTTQMQNRMSAIDRMLSYMMLANVLTFLITQIPLHIYTVLRAYINTFDNYTHLLIYAFLLIWSSLYFGIAFYLYCLASPLFRRKFIKITQKIIHCGLS